MSSNSTIQVSIIGCGLIGTQWDQPESANVYSRTHAAAFTKHPSSHVVAVCDQSLAKAEQAAARWSCDRAFSDPAALFAGVAVDLAVVAASSAARWSVIEPALKAGVKFFVIEKPLATTLLESKKLVNALELAGAKSLVNFSRRWDPTMRQLRDRLRAGEFGSIQRLVGLYGKGIMNNGSHMIDLATFLCDARPILARALGSPLDPKESGWSNGNDAALDAQIVLVDATGTEFHLTMLGTDQTVFTAFELRVIGSQAITEISQGGRRVTFTSIKDDPNFAGYRIPAEPVAIEPHSMESMDLMADEAIQLALGKMSKPSCDVHAALRTAMTVDAVKMSAQENGRWIEIDSLNTD